MFKSLLPLCLLVTALPARTQDASAPQQELIVGQVCALKGPAAGLGKGMNAGLQVYLDQCNKGGGAAGHRLTLRALNDGYEPKKTAVAVKALIDKLNAFVMIGGVGTPTSMSAVPICEGAGVPFVAPFTGAEFLRKPHRPGVVNLRASYFQETEKQAEYLVDRLGLERVACFYQDDSYGQAGLAGITQALERRGLLLCSTGTYPRNTNAVAAGLATIAESRPQAVVMVGAYPSCAAFIRAAKADERMGQARFGNLSFVGTSKLLKELGQDAEGCFISQVVPFPWDTTVPVVAEYTKAMVAAGREDELGFVTLEGYLAGKLLHLGIEAVDGEVTRGSFLEAVGSQRFDLGGVVLDYGKGDNQGLEDVWLTEFRGGKVVPLDLDHPEAR